MVTRTLHIGMRDAEGLYARMKEEGLLEYVVQGDGSYVSFLGILTRNEVFKEVTQTGETVGFWWVRHIYADAYSFHFCLFRQYRRHALPLFSKVCAGLEKLGAAELFCFVSTKRRDLMRICEKAKMQKIALISKEIAVWVAAKTISSAG